MYFPKTLKNKNVIKLAVSLLILLFLMKMVDFRMLWTSVKNVNSLFLIALAIIPFSILLRVWRWMIIINQNEKLISLKNAFSLTLVGIALNIFLPASSGEIAKSYYGYKWHGIKEEMLSSTIVDKMIALLALFMIGSVAAYSLQINWLAIFSMFMTTTLLFVVFYPRIIPWSVFNRFLGLFTNIQLDEKKLDYSFTLSHKIKIITLVISIFAWLVSYIQFFVVCHSFNLDISFIYILAIASLLNLSVLFPFTLNGIGSGEIMTVYLFSLIGIPPTLSILISLLYFQLFTIIPGLFGLIIIMKK